ncbi:MAG: ABC transporter ATP-binding protein [Cytophagales bacterium]|nr:ABC transporter ATP-binding protein [Cytophagales bacterium]MDW8384941.1 ABC transporter ATP-binding protein [Flammeovirgaceae bacterium]
MGTMLRVVNVSKKYPFSSKNALNNVSFSLKTGEWRAIVGANGSGKSTLLKILACALPADSGEIWLEDEQITQYSLYSLLAEHPHIQYVSQHLGLKPFHTIRENIAYPIRHLGERARRQRIEELLEIFELQEFQNQKPQTLSGGQQQRAALAVALANIPTLLLLDEPFSHLDMPLRFELYQVIQKIRNLFCTTILWVTPQLEEALAYVDTVSVLEKGCLVQTGTPQEIYYAPATFSIAKLFGEYNIVEGSIVRPSRIEIALNPTGNYVIQQVTFCGIYYRVVVEHFVHRQQLVVYSLEKLPLFHRADVRFKN